jgi:tetratricopeptide (TPR) repeat protein
MSVERGNLLYQTGRHDLAENEFRLALAQHPNDPFAHSMMSLCLLARKAYAEATEEARIAIQLRPDWAFAYSTMAAVLNERERPKEAIPAAEQAIALDPFNAANHGLLAMIRVRQRKWPEALAAANKGLEIDPENSTCVNARGVALVHLGQRGEASATISGALSRNPQNALTHANQGWALLHSGDHRKALEHFREALRINPELAWAKAGIVEAMQARNPIYRAMLKYFLFMSRMTPRVRWGIILGGWIGYQVLLGAQANYPQIRPFSLPLKIAYLVFVYLTWLAMPLFNLLLRIDRFGRHALSRDQRVASNWFAGILLVAGALAITGWVRGDENILLAALLVALLSIPVTSVFKCTVGWPRWTMTGVAAGVVFIEAGIIAMLMTGLPDIGDPIARAGFNALLLLLLIGLLGSNILANALIGVRVKR